MNYKHGLSRYLLFTLVIFLIIGTFTACPELGDDPYSVSGTVLDVDDEPLEGVSLSITGNDIEESIVETEADGTWEAVDLEGRVTIEPALDGYFFDPETEEVTDAASNVDFVGHLVKYSLTLEVYPEGVGTVEGAGEYVPGQIVDVAAYAEPGYVFDSWTQNGAVENYEASFAYEMPANDVTLVANFETIELGEYSITGYVTETKGGPSLEGARVIGPAGLWAETDAMGYFEFPVPVMWEEETFDLLVEQDGYAAGRIQDISVVIGELFSLEIPIREVFNPNWSLNPPSICIDGVDAYDVVDGDLQINISITGDRPIYVFYVYFSGLQRDPREGFFTDTGEGEVTIDTTKYPNGLNFLLVQAYDDNENLSMKFVPVMVDNDATQSELPGELSYLSGYSMTFGDTFGFYAERREELFREYNLEGDPYLREIPMDQVVDLSTLPEGITLYNYLFWDPVAGADGYSVYRSFDGENFELISAIPAMDEPSLADFSPKLAPEVPVLYYVAPYNSHGESEGLYRTLLPLDRLNVSLSEPADGATDVPVEPTFTWETHESMFVGTQYEAYREEIWFDYYFTLFDATWWLIADLWIEDEEEFAFPEPLDPATVYTWDIMDAEAFLLYKMEVDGFAYALSIASDMGGSINGEHIFTTEYDAVEGSE